LIGQRGGRSGMGRPGRFGLQPRRFSEILVTSITLVAFALTGVAAAATPDRAPSQSAGTSPAPDPQSQPVRLSPTHKSAPPVTVTPVSAAPTTTSSPSTSTTSPPRSSVQVRSSSVAQGSSTVIERAQSARRTPAPARKHHPPAARPTHRSIGPVSVDLGVPRIALPTVVASGSEPPRNGVLLLLSSLALGLLVVASLTLLRRVKRLNGGWWA
jgi:hypothetical protein